MDEDETDPRSARARLVNSLVVGVLQQLSEASQRPVAAARPHAGDVVLGLGAVAVEASRRVTEGMDLVLRPLAGILSPPTVVTAAPTRFLRALAERGRAERADTAAGLEALARRVAPRVLDRALSLVDLTDLVLDHVDIDALIADVDVDAVAARIDLDAILNRVDIDQIASRLDIDAVVARLDLVALAELVVEGIDLPGIIQSSTGSMASVARREVRWQGIGADERVEHIVDRMPRRGARRPGIPSDEPLPWEQQPSED